jgi:hypothetical protein
VVLFAFPPWLRTLSISICLLVISETFVDISTEVICSHLNCAAHLLIIIWRHKFITGDFSLSVDCLCTLIHTQCFFLLMRSNFCAFCLVSCFFFLAAVGFNWGLMLARMVLYHWGTLSATLFLALSVLYPRNHSCIPNPRSYRFYPKTFVSFSFALRSSIHIKFIVAYVCRQGSNFVLLWSVSFILKILNSGPCSC